MDINELFVKMNISHLWPLSQLVEYIFPHLIDGSNTSPPLMNIGVNALPHPPHPNLTIP